MSFVSVSYNLGNFVAGKRERAQRRRPHFPFPARPIPILVGFLTRRKCLRHFQHCMAFMQNSVLQLGAYIRTPLAGVRPSNLTNQPSLRSASWRFLNTHRAQVKTCHEIKDFGLGLQPRPYGCAYRSSHVAPARGVQRFSPNETHIFRMSAI